MASARKTPVPLDVKRRPAAKTPQARENQIIALATDLAEQQIINGTVSAQVLTHYIKLATAREQLERDKLFYEIELRKAQAEQTASYGRTDEKYDEVIRAMRRYSGDDSEDA